MAKNNNNSTTSKVQECFQKLMEEAQEKTNLSEIFEKAEAIADKHNLQLPKKPESWIMDTLDFVDKGRVLEEWLLQASKKSAEDEPAAPTEKAEPDSVHRELPSQQQPSPEEKFNNPPKGEVFTFESTKKILMRLNKLSEELLEHNDHDQTRGRVCDIRDCAIKLGADSLVKVCKSFSEGDATRATVFETVNEVLAKLADETRKIKLREAFKIFCECNGTTIMEMREIIG